MQETNETPAWKRTPVTVGLLLSLAGGIYYGAGYIDSREAEAVREATHRLHAEYTIEIANIRIDSLAWQTRYERDLIDREIPEIKRSFIELKDQLLRHIEEFDERIDELEQKEAAK